MQHAICRVSRIEQLGPYLLRVGFDDGVWQTIDFAGILAGEIHGPLRDPELFHLVRIDPEAHTLVWPNGADFDPETLHDGPKHETAFREMAERWSSVATS